MAAASDDLKSHLGPRSRGPLRGEDFQKFLSRLTILPRAFQVRMSRNGPERLVIAQSKTKQRSLREEHGAASCALWRRRKWSEEGKPGRLSEAALGRTRLKRMTTIQGGNTVRMLRHLAMLAVVLVFARALWGQAGTTGTILER